MKYINYLYAALAGIVIILIAVFYPASASFDPRSGTLRLIARFRVQTFTFIRYRGKKMEIPQGPVIFSVDYSERNIVKYAIFVKGVKVLSGSNTFKSGSALTGALPDKITEITNSTINNN